MESVFYEFENENFMKTKEEILKEATKRTLNINEGSPLHDAVMKAMEEYAQQQVKNCSIPAVSVSLERAKKYGRHQHYLGTQNKPLVEWKEWEAKD